MNEQPPAIVRAMTCETHGITKWQGHLFCGARGVTYQVKDVDKPRFAPEICPCGARAVRSRLDLASDDAARSSVLVLPAVQRLCVGHLSRSEMKKPKVTKQRIAYPDDPLMAASWLAAIRCALTSQPDMIKAFAKETGLALPTQPRSAIEAVVDEATKVNSEIVDAFVDWFNVNVWGEDPFQGAAR